MSEIVNASAVRFDSLSATGDGYTLLSINGKVCKSNKLLSEMVQSAVDAKHFATEQWVEDQGYLTEHQSISADEWNSCYETVSANSATWETETDWTEIIEAASANAVDTVEDKFEYNENDEISAYNGSAFAIPESTDCNSWKQYSEDSGSSGEFGSIYIGENNIVMGHSVGIGWNNTTNDSSAANSILIGDSNTAYTDYEYLASMRNGSLVPTKKDKYVKYDGSEKIITNEDLDILKAATNQILDLINNCSTLTNEQKINWQKLYAAQSLSYAAYYLSQTNIDILESGWKWPDETYINFYNNIYYPAAYEYHTEGGDKTAYINLFGDTDNDETLRDLDLNCGNIWNTSIYPIIMKYEKEEEPPIEVIPGYVLTGDNVKVNNFIVGTNNNANHYNSYVFGSNNITESAASANYQNDDGFVVAFGLGNYAARNYDMAIGYNAIASGGENIAIGAPQRTNKYAEDTSYYSYLKTKAVGYKNIAIRSVVSGIENIAANSIITHSAAHLDVNTNNLFLNAMIDGYSEAHNNIIANVAPGFYKDYDRGDSYPIKLGAASFSFIQNTLMENMGGEIDNSLVFSDRYDYNNCGDPTIVKSKIYRSLVGFGASPVIYSKIDASIYGFNSTALSASVDNSISIRSRVSGLISDTLLIGASAAGVVGSIVVTDGSQYGGSRDGNNVRFVSRSLLIGDNNIQGKSMNAPDTNIFVMGVGNNIYNSVYNSRIFGSYNAITSNNVVDSIDTFGNSNVIDGFYNRTFGRSNYINGSDNEVFGYANYLYYPGEYNTTAKCYNYIRGINNYLYSANTIAHSTVFGTNNSITGNNNSFVFMYGNWNAIKTSNDQSTPPYGNKNAYVTVFGTYNVISSGDNYHTMLVGQNNSATSAAISYAFGTNNYVKSACSYALGEGIKSNYNQVIVGKFNEDLANNTYYRFGYRWNSSTNRVEQVPRSGVIFAIGNGYLDDCYEIQNGSTWTVKTLDGTIIDNFDVANNAYLKRSNAMVVSADGTVSATNIMTSAGYVVTDVMLTSGEYTSPSIWEEGDYSFVRNGVADLTPLYDYIKSLEDRIAALEAAAVTLPVVNGDNPTVNGDNPII